MDPELSIGNEKHSLPLCAHVAGYGKSGHILVITLLGMYTHNLPDVYD